MKVTVINGSPRKGNTYAATQIFKNEMSACGKVEFTEFFLPQDMPKFCVGCTSCFDNGENTCPNSEHTMPIFKSMLDADAIIITTPVYVMQAAGAVTTFLNHSGYLSLVHRPHREMFRKKAFVLSTTSAAGAKAAIKPIVTVLKNMGINRVYSSAVTMKASAWSSMNLKLKEKLESELKTSARRFYQDVASGKKHRPYMKTKLLFTVFRNAYKRAAHVDTLDVKHWIEKDLINKSPF